MRRTIRLGGASTAPGAFAPVFPLLADDVVFLVLGQVSPAFALMLEMFVHAGAEKRVPPLALPITVVVVVVMVLTVSVPLGEADTRFGSRGGVGRRGEQDGGRHERGSEHQDSHSWSPWHGVVPDEPPGTF